jgi:hypothetical protein
MTDADLFLLALGFLMWNCWMFLLKGGDNLSRSELEEYRFAYQFYKDEYERVAVRVYTDQEREEIHDRYVEGWWEHMTRAGYPPTEKRS